VLSPEPAPPIAGKGTDDSAGARDAGEGTGAGGTGQGTGSGGCGDGAGGVGGTKAVKIAGDFVSARDYPAATRNVRLGSAVTIALTVSAQGRPTSCRVLRASKDPEADQITCRLAVERFRFRPAQNAAGELIPSTYGWQQRWFAPVRD
jgi:protein TonB